MSAANLLAAFAVLAIVAYLTYAMLRPEKF
jgi:K+-transporting ATPase KdpF subunit